MCFPICYMIYSTFVVFQNNETLAHTREREFRAPDTLVAPAEPHLISYQCRIPTHVNVGNVFD